jgi:hypothetical protein
MSAFCNRPPVLSQCGAAHEQAEMSGIDQLARYVLGWS